ncbi:MAG: sugar transferase [Microthrixaceae bacterium]
MRVDQRHPFSNPTVLDRSPDGLLGAGPVEAGSRRDRPSGHRWWSPLWLLLLADAAALGAAATLTNAPARFAGAAVVTAILGLRMANLYRRVLLPTALGQSGTMTMSVAAGALVAAAVTGTPSATAMTFTALASPALCACRALAYARQRRAATLRPQRAIVVGSGSEGQDLVSRLLGHPEYGIEPLGFVDTNPNPIDPDLPVTVLGELASLSRIVKELRVQRIFLDSASVSESELLDVLDLASGLDVEISVLPALARHLSTSITVEGVAGATVLSYRPARHYGISWGLKRVIDVVGALVALTVTAPVALAIAIAVKLDSPGPVIYKQERVGRHGRTFTIYKFRSMQVDADAQKVLYLDLNEASGPYFKLESDPRITRVGRWIRRFSVDEIPQMINVLRGDMSLVGPRPALATEVAEYPDWFRRRLAVRPGLSGLWQVSGRFLVPFSEATRLDVSYVDYWSLGLDLQILARTPGVVLSGRGAR